MRVLALDFDGVISDSAAEAFAVALPTYLSLRRVPEWAALAARIDRMTRIELLGEPLCGAFIEAMPLGNRAEDFGVVLRALETGAPLLDQADYDRAHADAGETFRRAYHTRFYAERAALRARAPERWLSLMAPYQPFLDVLRAHVAGMTFAIATAKDRPSVDLLLDAYGVADLFAPELILDKEAGPDKRAHVSALAQRLGVALEALTFVDDKVNHLDRVAGLGVRCALAGWGYNGERERVLALERGYPVLTLDDVASRLFGERPAHGSRPSEARASRRRGA